MSHPAWVCGLKPIDYFFDRDVKWSHPAWVCGLKLIPLSSPLKTIVTPCVGVWIETTGNKETALFKVVTPCVGVWIETCNIIKTARTYVSHPAWVCGLKPCDNDIHASFVVTPCVGVWIETI